MIQKYVLSQAQRYHSEAEPLQTYPMQKQALTVEYLRDFCHLRARTREIGAMLRLRDSTTRAFHNYFAVSTSASL